MLKVCSTATVDAGTARICIATLAKVGKLDLYFFHHPKTSKSWSIGSTSDSNVRYDSSMSLALPCLGFLVSPCKRERPHFFFVVEPELEEPEVEVVVAGGGGIEELKEGLVALVLNESIKSQHNDLVCKRIVETLISGSSIKSNPV